MVCQFLVALAMLINGCAPTPVLPTPQDSTRQPVVTPVIPPELTPPAQTPDLPPALESARHALAEKLGLTPDEVQIASFTGADWPDGCLGLPEPGEACTEAIVPGFGGILMAGGSSYEFRTDRQGERARYLPGAAVQARQILAEHLGVDPMSIRVVAAGAVEWKDGCLELSLPNARCAQVIVPGFLVKLELDEQIYTYHTDADGRLVLRADPYLVWRREGGIAGFCDQVTIHIQGDAEVASCHGEPGMRFALSDLQLQQVLGWVAQFKSFTYHEPKGAVPADGLIIDLVFAGAGQQVAGDSDVLAMQNLASQLALQAQQTAEDSTRDADLQAARAALESYFRFLVAGDYAAVIQVYGGGYETLQGWNPDINSEDHAALFERGCSQNGLVCSLSIASEMEVDQATPSVYRFVLELQNPDGSRFQQGPCCGADPTSEPPTTRFEFLVGLTEGGYKVMTLPVYVP